MLMIEPTGAVLGAVVRGIDLAAPLADDDFSRILLALGCHGVLRFPGQRLDLGALKRFSERFGEIRLIRRVQVMATKVFGPEFLRPARALAAAGADRSP